MSVSDQIATTWTAAAACDAAASALHSDRSRPIVDVASSSITDRAAASACEPPQQTQLQPVYLMSIAGTSRVIQPPGATVGNASDSIIDMFNTNEFYSSAGHSLTANVPHSQSPPHPPAPVASACDDQRTTPSAAASGAVSFTRIQPPAPSTGSNGTVSSTASPPGVVPNAAGSPPLVGSTPVDPTGQRGRFQSTGRSIVVTGLPPTMFDFVKLRQLFTPFGAVTSARVLSDPDTHVCKGVGYVNFESAEDARRAQQAMNGATIVENGPQSSAVPTALFTIQVNAAREDLTYVSEETTKIFIRHIPRDITPAELTSAFRQYGTVLQAVIQDDLSARGRQEGTALKMGYITFSRVEEALAAMHEGNRRMLLPGSSPDLPLLIKLAETLACRRLRQSREAMGMSSSTTNLAGSSSTHRADVPGLMAPRPSPAVPPALIDIGSAAMTMNSFPAPPPLPPLPTAALYQPLQNHAPYQNPQLHVNHPPPQTFAMPPPPGMQVVPWASWPPSGGSFPPATAPLMHAQQQQPPPGPFTMFSVAPSHDPGAGMIFVPQDRHHAHNPGPHRELVLSSTGQLMEVVTSGVPGGPSSDGFFGQPSSMPFRGGVGHQPVAAPSQSSSALAPPPSHVFTSSSSSNNALHLVPSGGGGGYHPHHHHYQPSGSILRDPAPTVGGPGPHYFHQGPSTLPPPRGGGNGGVPQLPVMMYFPVPQQGGGGAWSAQRLQ